MYLNYLATTVYEELLFWIIVVPPRFSLISIESHVTPGSEPETRIISSFSTIIVASDPELPDPHRADWPIRMVLVELSLGLIFYFASFVFFCLLYDIIDETYCFVFGTDFFRLVNIQYSCILDVRVGNDNFIYSFCVSLRLFLEV